MTKIITKPGSDTLWNRVLYAFMRQIISIPLRVYLRGSIAGREHLPDGAFILAPVHRSYIDTPISSWVQFRRMRYLGKESMWKVESLGKLFTAMGAIPVSRGSIDREALKRCMDVLTTGQPLVLFPEGERKDGATVQPLMDGAAFLAAKCDVPIVPMAIAGSDKAMPRSAKFVYPRKVHLEIGAPLRVETNDKGRASREQLAATTDELHAAMQSLYDHALSIVD